MFLKIRKRAQIRNPYIQVPHLTQNITSVRERISLALGQSFFYHRVKVRPQCRSEYSSPT